MPCGKTYVDDRVGVTGKLLSTTRAVTCEQDSVVETGMHAGKLQQSEFVSWIIQLSRALQ